MIDKLRCEDEACPEPHVTVAAIGVRCHVVPFADEEVESIKGETTVALGNPDNRAWGVDILMLRLIARIEEESRFRASLLKLTSPVIADSEPIIGSRNPSGIIRGIREV